MNRPDPQPDLFARKSPPKPTRATVPATIRTYAPRDVMTLPDDYGETTDWTPRATPFDIEWFEAPERAWNVGFAA